MPDTSPKKAQKEETNSEYIKIRVVDADSIEVQFKAKNLHQKKLIFLLLKIISFIKLEKKKGPVCFSE